MKVEVFALVRVEVDLADAEPSMTYVDTLHDLTRDAVMGAHGVELEEISSYEPQTDPREQSNG